MERISSGTQILRKSFNSSQEIFQIFIKSSIICQLPFCGKKKGGPCACFYRKVINVPGHQNKWQTLFQKKILTYNIMNFKFS